MPFDATTQIFNYMDTVTTDFVATNLSRIINTVTPVVALGLTMSLMVEGLFLMIRADGEPLGTLVNRFIRYAIIISIASAGGWYQQSLANVAMKRPTSSPRCCSSTGRAVRAARTKSRARLMTRSTRG